MSPGKLHHNPMSLTERFIIQLPIEMSIALEECAKANGVSQAEIVREALADYLGMEG